MLKVKLDNVGFLNLPRYVSLLKNLRAVVFLDPDMQIPIEEIKWLRRKYRYRNIGVSESLVMALKAEAKELFLKKPFEILRPPLLEIENFIRSISEFESEIPAYVIESLILTSCYVNALVVLRRDSLSILNPFITWTMKSAAELSEMEVKRNLRIIGYAIIDFYGKNAEQAYRILKEIAEKIRKKEDLGEVREELYKFLEERKKLARNDGEKRFWRLRHAGGEEERIVIAYLDVIPLISKILLQKSSLRLVNFIAESTLNLSMALSLIPAFILQLK